MCIKKLDRLIEPSSDLNNLRVLVDIVFETLGILTGNTNLLLATLDETPQLKTKLEELLAVVSTKEWREVFPIAESLFKLIIAGEIWKRASTSLKKRLSFGLALRCVPIVGWFYISAALIISIKKNYLRFSF